MADAAPEKTPEKTLDNYLDAAMNAGEKTVTLPTALLLRLYQDAAEGVMHAVAVRDNWERGDLAGAVGGADAWADEMMEAYADMKPTFGDGDEDEDEDDEPELGTLALDANVLERAYGPLPGDDFDDDPQAYDAKADMMKPQGDPLRNA